MGPQKFHKNTEPEAILMYMQRVCEEALFSLNIVRPRTPQNSFEFILWWSSISWHRCTVKSGLFPRWDDLGKKTLFFICKTLSFSNSFWDRDKDACLLLLVLETPGSDFCRPCVYSILLMPFLWVPVCVSSVFTRPCFHGFLYPLWLLFFLPALL